MTSEHSRAHLVLLVLPVNKMSLKLLAILLPKVLLVLLSKKDLMVYQDSSDHQIPMIALVIPILLTSWCVH